MQYVFHVPNYLRSHLPDHLFIYDILINSFITLRFCKYIFLFSIYFRRLQTYTSLYNMKGTYISLNVKVIDMQNLRVISFRKK